jgi:hypothetical protein
MNKSETIVISRHRSNEKWFAIHGCPKELHSDNGPQYSLAFFQVMELQTRHIKPTPSSFEWFDRQKEDNTDIELALLMARSTPAENLPSSAERLFKRKRTLISIVEKQPVDLKNEKITAQIERNRNRQKHYTDQHSKRQPEFEPREKVLLRRNNRWTHCTTVVHR